MTTREKPVQLFLSYTRKDEAAVAEIYERLAAVGLKPWMDQEDILPGEIWQESILHAIRDSHFFLACVSPNSVEKRGVLQRELREALDAWKDKLPGDIYLIPVRLEDCTVPEQLSQFQWVNLFDARGWTRLLKAIQRGTERLGLLVPDGLLSELAPAPTSPKTPTPAQPTTGAPPAATSSTAPSPAGNAPTPAPTVSDLLTITKPIHLELVRVPAGKENHPVVNITWDESVAFCQWLSQASGHEVRLPSQAEWEKAARGVDGRAYPWGDGSPNPDLCNFKGSGIGDTTPVDRYPKGASPYGALDMAGNVSEWTTDKEKGGWFWRKGGAYRDDAENMRSAARHTLNPRGSHDFLGFRVLAVPISRFR